MQEYRVASREEVRIPARIEPKINALSTETKGLYTFDTLVRHQAFQDYKGPIIATDFVVVPGVGVRKEAIMAGDVLVGFKFTGEVDGQQRTVINIDHHDSHKGMQ